MKCLAVSKILGLHVSGDLPEVSTLKIERHIAVCPTCAALARDMIEDRSWLQETLAQDADQLGFSDPAVFRMHAKVMANVQAASKDQSSRRVWQMSAAVGCVGLLFTGLFVIVRPDLNHAPSMAIAKSRLSSSLAPAALGNQMAPIEATADVQPDWRRHWMRDSEQRISQPKLSPESPTGARRGKPVEIGLKGGRVRILWIAGVQLGEENSL